MLYLGERVLSSRNKRGLGAIPRTDPAMMFFSLVGRLTSPRADTVSVFGVCRKALAIYHGGSSNVG